MCNLYVGKYGTTVKLRVNLYLLAFHIVLEFSLIQFVDEIILCTRKHIYQFLIVPKHLIFNAHFYNIIVHVLWLFDSSAP